MNRRFQPCQEMESRKGVGHRCDGWEKNDMSRPHAQSPTVIYGSRSGRPRSVFSRLMPWLPSSLFSPRDKLRSDNRTMQRLLSYTSLVN